MKIAFTLLCCLLWASCGPTTSSPQHSSFQFDTFAPEKTTATLKKTEGAGVPAWHVHFGRHFANLRFDGERVLSMCGHFFEREAGQTTPAQEIGRGCWDYDGWEEWRAEVQDHWWGTTREFYVRLWLLEGRQSPIESAPSPTLAFTFPPMPAEYILAKMKIKTNATCFTPTTITSEAECIRRVLVWEAGKCRRPTELPAITAALTPYSPDTLAETLDTQGVQAHQTVCYSAHSFENQRECENVIGGYVTNQFPGHANFPTYCLKTTRLQTILDVYASQPSPEE